MKVLLFMASPGDAHGGMEKHFYDLANGLAEKGVQVSCLAASEHLPGLHPDITRIAYRAEASRYSPRNLLTLLRLLQHKSFDVVHAQGGKAAGIVQMIAPLFRNTVFIATVHGFKSRYPAAQRFSRVIAVSKALARDIGQDNISIIYNGVEAQSEPAGRHESTVPTFERPTWLAVGRLVPAKGFDMLIDAFQHVNGSLVIAGDGPERGNLSQQITRLGLEDRISLLGHRTDIPHLLQMADGVVISSRREGFSYVFAEALLAEKPIVATDVPIANEFLLPEFIVKKPESSEYFAEYLNIDLENAANLQQSAQARGRQELTLEGMVENTLRIYELCKAL